MEGQKTTYANENLSSLNKLGNLFVNNEKNNLNLENEAHVSLEKIKILHTPMPEEL